MFFFNINRNLFRGLIIILSLSSISFPLKIVDQTEFYIIDPTSIDTLQKEMIEASTIPSENPYHKPTGAYVATVSFNRYSTSFSGGYCSVHNFEFLLNGKTIVPKLKEKKRYFIKLQLGFDAELYIIKHHENKHKNIWISVLEHSEKEIKSLKTKDTESCSNLNERVNTIYENALNEAKRRNSVFDCITYGNRLNTTQKCDEY